jgi:hypothetical protein
MRTIAHTLVMTLLTIALIACTGNGTGTPKTGADQPAPAAQQLPTSIALKAANNAYVSSNAGLEDDRAGILIADRPEAGEWETFELVDLGGGKVALRASNGKFVCADRSIGGLLVANRDTVGDWETFELLSFDGDRKVLRATDGRYVTADLGLEGDLKGRLFADRPDPREWETFRFEEVPVVQ